MFKQHVSGRNRAKIDKAAKEGVVNDFIVSLTNIKSKLDAGEKIEDISKYKPAIFTQPNAQSVSTGKLYMGMPQVVLQMFINKRYGKENVDGAVFDGNAKFITARHAKRMGGSIFGLTNGIDMTLQIPQYDDPEIVLDKLEDLSKKNRSAALLNPDLAMTTAELRKKAYDELGLKYHTNLKTDAFGNPIFKPASFTLYHTSEVAGLPPSYYKKSEVYTAKDDACNTFAKEMAESIGYSIIEKSGVNDPYINFGNKAIMMPPKGAYENTDNYYTDLFSQIIHVQGAESKRFDVYAKDEKTLLMPILQASDVLSRFAKERLIADVAVVYIGGKLGKNLQPRNLLNYHNEWMAMTIDNPKIIEESLKNANKIVTKLLKGTSYDTWLAKEMKRVENRLADYKKYEEELEKVQKANKKIEAENKLYKTVMKDKAPPEKPLLSLPEMPEGYQEDIIPKLKEEESNKNKYNSANQIAHISMSDLDKYMRNATYDFVRALDKARGINHGELTTQTIDESLDFALSRLQKDLLKGGTNMSENSLLLYNGPEYAKKATDQIKYLLVSQMIYVPETIARNDRFKTENYRMSFTSPLPQDKLELNQKSVSAVLSHLQNTRQAMYENGFNAQYLCQDAIIYLTKGLGQNRAHFHHQKDALSPIYGEMLLNPQIQKSKPSEYSDWVNYYRAEIRQDIKNTIPNVAKEEFEELLEHKIAQAGDLAVTLPDEDGLVIEHGEQNEDDIDFDVSGYGAAVEVDVDEAPPSIAVSNSSEMKVSGKRMRPH